MKSKTYLQEKTESVMKNISQTTKTQCLNGFGGNRRGETMKIKWEMKKMSLKMQKEEL